MNGAGLEPEGCDECVDEHACDAKDEAHGAEQVKGTAHVFADVHDGEQVKKSFEQTPPAVFGYAKLSRVVLDGNLTDAISFQVGEYGDVAVEFAEYAYVFCDFAAIGFEAAVKVVYVNARYIARDPVEKFGGQGFAQWVKAFFLPARDEVITFFEFGQQVGDFCRVVLQVGVHGDDICAACVLKSGGISSGFAKVAPKLDDFDFGIGVVQVFEDVDGPIGAAVVNEDDFVGEVPAGEHAADFFYERTQAFFFVEQGYDEAEVGHRSRVVEVRRCAKTER